MNLVPYPRSVVKAQGTCTLRRSTAIVTGAPATACIRHKLKEIGIAAVFRKASSLPTCVIGAPPSRIPAPPDKPEGYVLHVAADGAVVVGRDLDGLFWGLTTLQQLMVNGTAPCVRITDWPAYRLRYHHDDISRKQISRLADFKRIIRLLSYYKVKYYTPYMEDVLYLKSFPDIGERRGRLTAGEVKAMLAEARKYNVTVFPTYSLIGHQENLLQNPRYRRYAKEVFQEPSSYDPSKKALYPYLRKVIRDVCELFPDSPLFHACFDETQGVDEESLTRHARWCAAELRKHGKLMMMWVDMWKNHFGIERLKLLPKTIVPVEWNYGDPQRNTERYAEAGVIPTGLAGYSNWCAFLPEFSRGKGCIDRWTGVMGRWNGAGFGCSMWGDNGYENSRDLCWNLYAYYAEVSWRGTTPAPRFEPRFEQTFYGAVLPGLARLVERTSERRALGAGQAWRLFRYTMPAMVRLACAQPGIVQKARKDLTLLKGALGSLRAARRAARTERGHLDHFEVALLREINVRERLVLAGRVGGGLRGAPLHAAVRAALLELERVRERYRAVWLRHNKRENIEVSLAVYDTVAEGLRELLAEAASVQSRFTCVDMSGVCAAFAADVGGIPLQRTLVNDVPFEFAARSTTHCTLPAGVPVRLAFGARRVRDIHLVYGGQTIDKKTPKPVVEVALLHGGKVVFAEELKSITQICDWWAPLGEHMWAGGGFKYLDKKRNAYALKPGENYGLMHLRNFAIPQGVVADTLRLTRLGTEEFNLFAATVQAR